MKSFRPFIEIMFWLTFYLLAIFSKVSAAVESKVLSKTAKKVAVNLIDSKAIDVNNLVMWVQNNGLFASQLPDDQRGLLYPKIENGELNTNKTLIYTSGIMMGAMVGDSLRTMVNTFSVDCCPGAIDSDGQPYGLADPTFRIYKIGTAPEFRTGLDYQNWPINQGAPVDKNGKPYLMGDQLLWCCFTDGYPYPTGHQQSLTQPLGAEIHLLVYAWENLEHIIFLRWEIINKSRNFWNNAYVGIFADCELGEATDDLVGSDSLLQLVYDYNGDDFDDYSYGKYIPAVGYALLQSPIVISPGDTAVQGYEKRSGYKNTSVCAPLYYKHGLNWQYDIWDEFYYASQRSASQAYLRMQGLNEKGEPMINPVTGQKTRWGLSGDPVDGTGWLDPQMEDRRFMLSAGPFDMAPGDTQVVVLAVTVGQGKDRLASVTVVKTIAALAHAIYRSPGVLYINQTTADPLPGNVDIPITFFNPEMSFSTLNFEVNFDPAWLTISEVVPTFRSMDLELKMTPLTPGKVSISILRPGHTILAGTTPLLILKGKINPQTPKGTLEVNFSRISALNIHQQAMVVPGFPGMININHYPATFRLISPPDQYPVDTFDALKSVKFTWRQTNDLDGDSLTYHCKWLDQVASPPQDFYITGDTTFRFNGQGFFQAGRTYHWTVEAVDDQQGKASQDTFSLTIGKLNKLLRVNQIKLPTSKQFWPSLVRVDQDILYFFGWDDTENGLQKIFLRYQLTNRTAPKFIDKYVVPTFDIIDDFMVQNGYGYVTSYTGDEGPEVRIYNFSGPDPWQFKNQINLSYASPNGLQITSGYLIVWISNPEVEWRIYDLTNRLLPRFRYTLKLPYTYSNRCYQLRNQRLYLAGKDFSGENVFKIYNLNATFQLVDSTSMRLPGSAYNLSVDDKFAYVSIGVGNKYWDNDAGGELYLIDITDAKNPRIISYIPTLLAPSARRLNSEKLLLNYGALDVYDIQQPENPIQISHYYGLKSPIVMKESYIYGVEGADKLSILNSEKSIIPEENLYSGTQLIMDQNYPNPFHTGTIIRYYAPETGKATIDIFDLLGRRVNRFERIILETGLYFEHWNGRTGDDRICAAGIYWYRIKIGKQCKIKKMVKL